MTLIFGQPIATTDFSTAMDHFKNIYTHHAETYHRMITAEDVDNNLLTAMVQLMPFAGKKVLDLGSGTGRIPILIHEQTEQIIGLDLHWGMLIEQQTQRDQRSSNWGLLQGDMRELPFPENLFDAVSAGWALGHFQDWFKGSWQTKAEHVIREMMRVVIPSGLLLIIETLTTGSLTPAPPTPGLANYYAWLENKWGFSRQQIQTDYQFQNLEEAAELTTFFFGAELAERVRVNNWVRLPEWTGLWWKRNL